jgi:hypothetical protein
MNKSKVLILAIGSNGKTRQGESSEYSLSGTIRQHLPEQIARELYSARKSIFNLILSNKVSRDGKLLSSFPLNKNLGLGPDLQFSPTSKRGLYLAAAARFSGRFYSALGKNRLLTFMNSPHHVIIVTPLYGLLKPFELIQCFSCNVTDHPDIAKRWTKNDLLSRIILTYIETHGITKVFDFMAADTYRNLISWEMIRHATKNNVLHCFSRQYAGGALLPSLGQLAKEFLAATGSELLGLKANDSWQLADDEIIFQPFPVPENPDVAREIHQQRIRLKTSDKIGRMRRNIIVILHEIPKLNLGEYEGFSEWVKKLRNRGARRNHEIAALMHNFAEQRNQVEYNGLVIYEDSNEWHKLRHDYDEIERWAIESKYIRQAALEEIDV